VGCEAIVKLGSLEVEAKGGEYRLTAVGEGLGDSTLATLSLVNGW